MPTALRDRPVNAAARMIISDPEELAVIRILRLLPHVYRQGIIGALVDVGHRNVAPDVMRRAKVGLSEEVR